MSRVRTRTRVTLPLAGLVLAIAVLILAGCGGSASGHSGNGSASGHASVTNNQGTPVATISGQAGQSTRPLPSDIPAPPNATLQREYTAQVNGRSATVWQYVIPASSVSTPQNVASLYQQQMPAKGWTSAAVPTVTVSSANGAPAAAQIYQQNGQLATIATGYVSGNSGPVAVIITFAK